MVRRWTVVALALLLGPVLSGCIGADEVDLKGDGLAEDAAVTESTGSVTGQVMTLELEFLANVEVGLLNRTGDLRLGKTDRMGNFTFNGMPAGPYRVQISDPCCKIATMQVDVVAGKVTQANMQVTRLTDADLKTPFVSEEEWQGLLSCAVGVLTTDVEPCRYSDPNDDFAHLFNITEGIQELRLGVDWKRGSTSLTDELKILVYNRNCGGCGSRFGAAIGPPPLYVTITDTNIDRESARFYNINGSMDMEYLIGPGSNNVVYQQSFTVYWSEFYHRLAPGDYDPIPERI